MQGDIARRWQWSAPFQDRADPLRYLTVDRWQSLEAWRSFRSRFAADYERLDREFERLATHEAALGEYRPAGA